MGASWARSSANNGMPKQRSSISVCALLPYPENSVPAQRYRIEQWRPYLEAEDISIDILPFADPALVDLLYKPGRVAAKAMGMASGFARRTVDVMRSTRYDVVLIHRAA